jgi:hypothetical protein
MTMEGRRALGMGLLLALLLQAPLQAPLLLPLVFSASRLSQNPWPDRVLVPNAPALLPSRRDVQQAMPYSRWLLAAVSAGRQQAPD